MKKLNIEISGTYIELIKLLKLARITATGGEAKEMVLNGKVKVDGTVEKKLRCKIRVANIVEVGDTILVIV